MRTKEIKILLVDDDEITNFLSREVLQLHFTEAEITTVTNGEEALEFLASQLNENKPLPNIMLLDINMPLMNGWEFLEKLAEGNKHDYSSINIFMYTSSVYFEDLNRAKKNGLLKNILTKPLNNEGIQEMISSVNTESVEQHDTEQLN
jgi:CheY-like chemotaxis protein